MTGVARAHRRLTVVMGLAGLVAFAGGGGAGWVPTLLTLAALLLALVWQPAPALSARLEKVWAPLAFILVVRAFAWVWFLDGDVVMPVVDLLLLLLAAESLRSLDVQNDVRIYALSFALLLAATAYRPGLLFAFAFVVYVVAASLALPLGVLRRGAERHRATEPGVDRHLRASGARLATVTLVVAALVFVAFPRVSRGWSGRGETMATAVAGFADRISLGEHGSRIHSNPEIVLRVEFPDGVPDNLFSLHWRGRSYDHFDGVRWRRSEGVRPSTAPIEWYRDRWGTELVTQRIYGAPLRTRVLFALHPLVEVDADGRIQPMFDNVGDFSYWGRAAPRYTVRSVATPPPADSLRRFRTGFMPDRTHYLQLPPLPDRIAALADSLTRDHDNRFDKVKAVERWLRTTFTYTRELPPTAAEATLDHFLFERRAGHCEYFSSAMVVLLRAAGIHARNVNGFLGGRWSDFGGYLAVTQNEAHSWVEVWFPDYGWVTFDPTPGGSGGRSTVEGEWLWPGRSLVDGLQHRWSKWVLDYSAADQAGILDHVATWFDDEEGAGVPPGESGGRGFPRALLALLVVGGALALLLRMRGRRGPRGANTREGAAYLKLLRAAQRAGVVDRSAVTPLHLAERIANERPPAGPPAARLVELYLRARFSPHPLDRAEERELHVALARARRALES